MCKQPRRELPLVVRPVHRPFERLLTRFAEKDYQRHPGCGEDRERSEFDEDSHDVLP